MVELAKPSRCGEQAQHIIDPINGTSRRSASIIANAAGEGRGRCGPVSSVGMSRRIELHGPPRNELQVRAEQRTDRAMESASPNMAGRLLVVAELAQALGLALGMPEGVA